MIRAILLVTIILLSSGCVSHIGKVTHEDGSSHVGIYTSIGNTEGPAGMKGAAISVPGAMLIGQVFKYVGEFASSVFGRPVIVSPVEGQED